MTARQTKVWEFCRYNGEIRTTDAPAFVLTRAALAKTCRGLTAAGVLEKTGRGVWKRRPVEFLRRCVVPAST
jgi:hypothetical protein